MLKAARPHAASIAPPPLPPPASAAMKVVAALLSERTGQDLLSSRAWRIDAVLAPLLRAQGLPDLDALVGVLTRDAGGPLASAVVDALLNQETSFYRDAGVAELVADIVGARHGPARRARIWSAGCATGQEPFSLAMLLADRVTAAAAMPDIVATDVSAGAIARARLGRFNQFEIQRGLPVRRMLGWFDQVGEEWVAKPELIRLVSFRRHNLVIDAPPFGQFDVILCRNVLLYFAGAMRRAIFERLAGALAPDGVLILGAGETTIGQTDRFRPSATWRGTYERAD